MKFLNNLDLQKNQLMNARAHCLPGAPTNLNSLTGMFYYDSTDNDFLVYTDEGWKSALYPLAIDIPQLPQSKITNLSTDLEKKVDKETGKGLSDNNFTTALKNKLDNAEITSNKVSSWSSTPDYTKYPSEKLVKDNLDAINVGLENIGSLSPLRFAGYFTGGTVVNDFNNLIRPFENLTEALPDFYLNNVKGAMFVCNAASDFVFNTVYNWSAAEGTGKTTPITFNWAAPYDTGLGTIGVEVGDTISILNFAYDTVENEMFILVKVEKSSGLKADKVIQATVGNIPKLNASGNLEDSGFTLGKSVPSNAVFTDTVYTLPKATEGALGGIKARLKDGTYTVEVKIDTDGKLYVPVPDAIPAETDPVFTAWDKSTGISITKSQVSDLIEATQALPGLMSATDKERLDVLHALLEEDEANTVVDSIKEILAIFNQYPEGADLVTALEGKVDKVTGKGLSTNDLTNTLKSNYNAAYGWGDHAVEGYLKSITKAMVEGVLTGTITSHNHNGVYEPSNSNIQSHISSKSNPHEVTTTQIGAEPAFSKNAAFNKNFGTTLNTVAQGNHLHTGVYEPSNSNIQSHISSRLNPHSVTKTQVDLGNVDNTSDLDKPISTAQQTALSNKVDKVTGKGLSTNDYTTAEKNKLANIAAGAEVNVQSDWSAASGDAYILNKPYIVGKYSANITLSQNTAKLVKHDLETTDVIVSLRDSSNELVYCDIEVFSVNEIKIWPANIGTGTSFRVTVIG